MSRTIFPTGDGRIVVNEQFNLDAVDCPIMVQLYPVPFQPGFRQRTISENEYLAISLGLANW